MQYLAKPLTLRIEHCVQTDAPYLRFLTPLGTWEGWLFAGDHDNKIDLAEASDISSADQRTSVAVRRAGIDTLTVRTGDLSEAQHQALSTILDSPQVYRQLPDGTRIPVLVAANASATRTSSDGRYELLLDVKLPARNSLTH
jgi:hypothetical protein